MEKIEKKPGIEILLEKQSWIAMKKRLAKKALKGQYYQIWFNPKTGQELWIPRNGRCWSIIQRAFRYFGHPEWIEEIANEILDSISEGK